jgi:glucose/arabinose dehydrogenase
LWTAVQERDKLGDDLVPDYITSLREGGFYGWPFAYAAPTRSPRHAGERPTWSSNRRARCAARGAFGGDGIGLLPGEELPVQLSRSAFATLRGSSNRSLRTG